MLTVQMIDEGAVAREFARGLRDEIGATDYDSVVRAVRSQGEDEGWCPSHDYCDANVVMMAAIERVTGLDYSAFADLEGYEDTWGRCWNSWRTSVRAER